MTVKNIFFIIAIQFLTLSTASSNEDSPTFNGTILKIPTVDSGGKSGAYQNVEFELLTDGNWKLVRYRNRVPVFEITKVKLDLTEGFPVRGFLTIWATEGGCSKTLTQIRHKLVGNTLKIFLDSDPEYIETESDCEEERMISSYGGKTIHLPLYGLKKGKYKYTVNGDFEGSFSLSRNNYMLFDSVR